MLYVCSDTDVSQQMSITLFFKFDFQQYINFINEPQCFYSKGTAVSPTSFSFPLGGHVQFLVLAQSLCLYGMCTDCWLQVD